MIAKSAWLISLGSQVLVAIDTSVLVAAIVAAHESHAPAKQWLDAVDRRELGALVSTHALAELYGVLTRIPGGLSPEEAQLTVGNLPNRMRVVPLTTGAYMTVGRYFATICEERQPVRAQIHVSVLPFAEEGKNRRRIRAHDLRGTFATLYLCDEACPGGESSVARAGVVVFSR